MRSNRIRWFALLLIAGVGSVASWNWLGAQAPPTAPPSPLPPLHSTPLAPPTPSNPVTPALSVQPAAPNKLPDLNTLPPLTRQLVVSMQRGSEWIYRMNQPTGRFLTGWSPTLNQLCSDDGLVPQTQAALALAHAAQLTGDERYTAAVRQAVLALLADCPVDPADPTQRVPAQPTPSLRLTVAGLLLAVIHEVPTLTPTLLEQGEQLANYLRKQLPSVGTWADTEGPTGWAWYGVICSQALRPAEWKLAAAKQVAPIYRANWNKDKQLSRIGGLAAAASRAYMRTQEVAYAEMAFELADAVCAAQYQQLDVRHPLWLGGVPANATMVAPDIRTAAYAEVLCHAARATRQKPDLARYETYRAAAARSLQFIARLQLTEDRVQHFVEAYRPRLLGAYHASHQDGELRLDYTQLAVAAHALYLGLDKPAN